MALAMFVGSANKISPSLFSPADTLAALLANKFPEAASPLDLGVLLALTLLVKVAGEMVMNHRSSAEGVRAHPGAAR